MSEDEQFILEIISEHLNVCEKRFSEIKTPEDFVNSEYGNVLLDAIVTRLQSIGENLKRLSKQNKFLEQKYPDIEWEKIIKFRDFISHHYERLDYEIVFDIGKNDFPKLKEVIQTELKNRI